MSSEVKLSVLFTAEQIAATVRRLAAEISRDYKDKNPVLIAVLKGSFVFLADLVRELNFPLQIEFAQLSSYGHGKESAGKIKVVKDVKGVGLAFAPSDKGLISVYDMQNKRYRFIPQEGVLCLTYKGQRYRVTPDPKPYPGAA